ncbi:lasso peptide biosynthesis B2 protein [Komarekiella sp. 'clone 1']|uniref:Lasso peptide biosynthesis B2 protein n=1 Tax=Komarekiella delphini-convector SJRDD-AB1 TaxID=2593771 RepID=A0AA40SZ57_9NOST|nr:lasso peptide biosynthesis B2 protein [Komarekiella delphini-convector]MBD6617650.1 lasso peptide biosynthesis B2 protein [Komarekiella delphini-convector SJRDD-AB1]
MDDRMSLNTLDISLSWHERLIGSFIVVVAYIAVRWLSIYRISKILSILKKNCSREVTNDEADIIWLAVRESSFLLLGRVACLEFSLAFVLLALTKGLSSTWCVGVTTEPVQAHAWVEINGLPFREVDNFEYRFRKLLAV